MSDPWPMFSIKIKNQNHKKKSEIARIWTLLHLTLKVRVRHQQMSKFEPWRLETSVIQSSAGNSHYASSGVRRLERRKARWMSEDSVFRNILLSIEERSLGFSIPEMIFTPWRVVTLLEQTSVIKSRGLRLAKISPVMTVPFGVMESYSHFQSPSFTSTACLTGSYMYQARPVKYVEQDSCARVPLSAPLFLSKMVQRLSIEFESSFSSS